MGCTALSAAAVSCEQSLVCFPSNVCLTVAALSVFALGPCLCVKHDVWGCLQELCKGIWHSGSTLCWLRVCHRKDESQA